MAGSFFNNIISFGSYKIVGQKICFLFVKESPTFYEPKNLLLMKDNNIFSRPQLFLLQNKRFPFQLLFDKKKDFICGRDSSILISCS